MSFRVRRLDHLGIAVGDLEDARRVFQDLLGLPLLEEEEVPDQQVHAVKLGAGDACLELLHSTDPEGPIGRYVAKRGPGIHHVTLEVDDLPAALKTLSEAGIRLIDEEPRIGAGGKRIAFLHPKSTSGILVELCEGD